MIAGSRPDAYLVGGSVRDLARGLMPLDYDIAVASDPQALAQEIVDKNGGRIVVLGKDRLTVYRVAGASWNIDITLFKGRDIREDLLNRDFTINALACGLDGHGVIDVTGGLSDLRQGVVRMISPSAFKDDPVRLVRAFRMAAGLDFHVEPRTIDAIRSHAALLSETAAERVWAEFLRILRCRDSYPHLQSMADARILSAILPELIAGPDADDNRSDILIRSQQDLRAIYVLEQILRDPSAHLPPEPARFIDAIDSERRALLKFSLLVADIGKTALRGAPDDRPLQLHGYAARSAAAADAIGRRLKMSNQHRQWIVSLVRRHQHPVFLFAAKAKSQFPPCRAVGRFFRICGQQTPHLLLLAMARSGCGATPDKYDRPELTDFLRQIFSSYCDSGVALGLPPILSGHDLIRLFKLRPSPLIGQILRRLEERRLAGEIIDRQGAIDWVANHLQSIR